MYEIQPATDEELSIWSQMSDRQLNAMSSWGICALLARIRADAERIRVLLAERETMHNARLHQNSDCGCEACRDEHSK